MTFLRTIGPLLCPCLRDEAPKALDLLLFGDAMPAVVVVATAVAAGVFAVTVVRRRLVRRMLSGRVSYTLLPTTSFDPTLEDIGRFAHQLARTRPAESRLRPRRGSSVRLRLHTGEDARLTYELSGPKNADSVLRHQAYAQVELRKVEPADDSPSTVTSPPGEESPRRENSPSGPAGEDRELHVARAELVLAGEMSRPIRAVPLKPDPLQSLAAAVYDVRPDLGERAEVCLDLLPLTAAKVAHLRRRHSGPGASGRGARVMDVACGLALGGTDLLLEFIDEFLPGHGGAGSAAPGRRGRDLPGPQTPVDPGKFIDPAEPLFAVQVLIRVESRIEGRAQAHLHQILAAFDAWRADNWWRVHGINLGFVHLGADTRLFRRRFDRRITTGEFRPRRQNLVTASEIAGLLKPPTKHCAHLNVARSGGMVPPAPRDLPVYRGQPGVIPLGYAPGPDGIDRLLGMPLADLFFSLRIGKSRYGKTEMALVQAVALALSGNGVWFLDPHADGWHRAQPLLTEVAGRLWEIDLTVRGEEAKIAGYNPLAMAGQNRACIEDRVDAVVTAIGSALSWGDSAPRAKTILTKACETLCHLALRLPADTAPTLFQIRTLLDDTDWRMAVLPALPRHLRNYWTLTFPKYPADATPTITNVIERLAASPTLSAFFGSSQSTYDVRRAMDTGRVVFLCPPGGDIGRLVSCFLIYDLFRAGRSRAEVPAERRRRYDAFVDELTVVDGAAKGYLASILEQLGKFGVHLHAMTQMAQRLTPATRDALLQNQSLLASTAGEIDAVKAATRQWGRYVEPETLVNLPRFHHVMAATLNGQVTTPFKVRGAQVTDLFDAHPEHLQAQREAIDTNLHRRPVHEVLADLDTLDDRILDALDLNTPLEHLRPDRPGHRIVRRGDGHGTELTPPPADEPGGWSDRIC